jgi:calcineurin-like phosphoesterase family protein
MRGTRKNYQIILDKDCTMIMLLGDTHGNTKFVINKVIPAARAKKINWIYQVGDFGYWEHQTSGIDYLDAVNGKLAEAGINLLFIQGNHDKVSMISRTYMEQDGFYKLRTHIWYAENGTVWSPDSGKTNFMALGGAYSVDKRWRLEQENKIFLQNIHPEMREHYPNQYKETLWFPEEEISDAELDVILNRVSERVDVLLTHDKPISAQPPIDLLPIAECEPNQRRIQKAVNTLKPKLLVHGHFHVRYTDLIRNGGDTYTVVEGLGADVSDEPERTAWDFLEI